MVEAGQHLHGEVHGFGAEAQAILLQRVGELGLAAEIVLLQGQHELAVGFLGLFMLGWRLVVGWFTPALPDRGSMSQNG